MRLLIKLKSLQDAAYEAYTSYKINGFIYSLLKNTPLCSLHDKNTPKFFCFSNIFPVENLKIGDERYLLISSPDNIFLQFLKYKLSKRKKVKIGELVFSLEEIKEIKTKINSKKIKLKTATPIVIRIPRNNYFLYNLKDKKRVEYWKPNYPISCFLKQLEENIFKKYKLFYNTELEEFPIFEKLKLIKTVATKLPINNNKDVLVIGSIWEFEFENLSKEKKEILEFALDCGFGEKNSYGFGFVNVV